MMKMVIFGIWVLLLLVVSFLPALLILRPRWGMLYASILAWEVVLILTTVMVSLFTIGIIIGRLEAYARLVFAAFLP